MPYGLSALAGRDIERSVGARLAFDCPAGLEENRQDVAGFVDGTSDSRCAKRHVEDLGRSLALLEPLGNDSQGQSLNANKAWT